jgi:hypothetical protein
MSEPQTPPAPVAAAAAPAATPAVERPVPQKPVARELPGPQDVPRWIAGEEAPVLGALFDQRNLKTFDALVMQIRKDELLPQHWQVITELKAPPDEEFDRLAEVGRLRLRYKDQELARRRIDPLRVAWRELRGKRPGLWNVGDLFAAMRRIYDSGEQVDFYDLLTATRDVWRDLTLPFGRQQLDLLWNVLELVREKTKK